MLGPSEIFILLGLLSSICCMFGGVLILGVAAFLLTRNRNPVDVEDIAETLKDEVPAGGNRSPTMGEGGTVYFEASDESAPPLNPDATYVMDASDRPGAGPEITSPTILAIPGGEFDATEMIDRSVSNYDELAPVGGAHDKLPDPAGPGDATVAKKDDDL